MFFIVFISSPIVSVKYSQSADVVPEALGNPFNQRFQDQPYPRNVWDMATFDGRLYLGHGNALNQGTSPNAGPTPIWSYDAETNRFVNEYVVPEEQISRFVNIDGHLYIPGFDAQESWRFGNFYRLDADVRVWHKFRTIPGAVHVYDLDAYHNQLYAAIGTSAVNTFTVAVSNDFGATWSLNTTRFDNVARIIPLYGAAWELFEINDQLYVSVRRFNQFVPSDIYPQEGYDVVPASEEVYWLSDDGGFQPVNINFFAPFPSDSTDYVGRRIARSLPFDQRVAYIGQNDPLDGEAIPFGLFSVDDALDVQYYPLGNQVLPYDLISDDSVLYVLTAQQEADRYTVGVQATCDFETWREVLQFSAPTFARSFALYEGDFYFGLGTDGITLSPASGDILRVGKDNFTLGCD